MNYHHIQIFCLAVLFGFSFTVNAAQQQAPSPDLPQKELKQLNDNLETLNQQKNTLKQQLATLDSAIEESQSKLLAARKRGIEILQQADEAAAKAIAQEVDQQLQSLITAQQTFQTSVANVQTSFTTIRNEIKNLETLVNQLKSKGVSIQVAKEEQAVPAPSTEPKQRFRSWLFATEQPTTERERQPEATFIHYLFNRIADLVTGAMRVIYTTYLSIKDAIMGTQTTAAPTGMPTQAPSTTSQTPAQPAAPAMPTTSTAPVMPTAPATQQQTAPAMPSTTTAG